MKKLFLTLLASLMLIGAYAQEIQRPYKGAVSAEIQFNPFEQSGKTFSMDGLKVRFFLTDIDAIRVKLGFAYGRDKMEEISRLSGNVKLDLGYERHLPLAKRVDFYFGGQLGMEKYYAKTKGEFMNNEFVCRGAVLDNIDFDKPFDGLKGENRAQTSFNIAAITGLDFYVYRGLYLGTELGFKIQTGFYDNVEFEYYSVKKTLEDDGFSTRVGLYVEPTIRLGYTF